MKYYDKNEEAITFYNLPFYRFPKTLFTNPRYKPLSVHAKILYCLMLDRMNLSAKNKKHDKQGHLYIFFRQEEAMEILGIGKDKAIKLYRELEEAELIERKRQGLTHPDIIYVGRPETETPEPPLNSEKPSSGTRKNRAPEVEKTAFPPFKNNKTYSNKTQSINQATPHTEKPNPAPSLDEYVEMFKLYTSYEAFKNGQYGAIIMDDVDELINLMADECSSDKPTIRIGGVERPRSAFRNRLLSITDTSILRILNQLQWPEPNHPIRNRRAYLLTMLYNHQSNNPHEEEIP